MLLVQVSALPNSDDGMQDMKKLLGSFDAFCVMLDDVGKVGVTIGKVDVMHVAALRWQTWVQSWTRRTFVGQ